ncbi:MAG: M15 family metallopeptidase, partial [Clostridia bacterium]|nr:M15 family metallopeptidase [Clostridia bacterium]
SPVGMTMSTLQKSKSDVAVGNLLLINPENAYVFPDHTPSTLVNIFDSRPYVTNDSGGKLRAYKVRNGNQILDRFALESLNRMMEAFYAEYKVTDMLVTWAHRTMAEQQDLYNLYVADYPGYTEAQIKQLLTSQVDTPGYSEHHLGTSVDIKLYSDSGVTYTLDDEPGYFAWLKENCWKYGYILRYPAEKATVTGVSYEPYHFRYVEVPHAYYMTENGLCLEEYLEQLAKTTSPDGEHLTFSVDGGNTYEVYYVKATSATVDIPVPADYPYTVSGDNQNGFIVTVTMN